MAATDWLSQGTLVLASNNKGKIAEFEKLFAELQLPVEVVAQGKLNIEDAIEDGLSFVENAIIKARHAAKISGKPAIADDSGICVPVLGGVPGIYSARYAGEHGNDTANNEKLLADLKPLRQDGEANSIKGLCDAQISLTAMRDSKKEDLNPPQPSFKKGRNSPPFRHRYLHIYEIPNAIVAISLSSSIEYSESS